MKTNLVGLYCAGKKETEEIMRYLKIGLTAAQCVIHTDKKRFDEKKHLIYLPCLLTISEFSNDSAVELSVNSGGAPRIFLNIFQEFSKPMSKIAQSTLKTLFLHFNHF